MKKYLTFILSVCLLFSFTCLVGQAEEENVLYIEMTVEQEEDGIEVHLVDGQGGSVSTWPVMLELDGVQVDTVLTDSEGYALFTYSIPEETGEIACIAKDGQYEAYRFVGCRVVLEQEAEPTQSEATQTTTIASDTTSTTLTTTVKTEKTTTVQTSTVDETTLTTMADGDRVAIGIVPDTVLLSTSQSSIPEYRTKARMWMDKALYDSLVSVSTATLQLQLKLNQEASEIARFIEAKNADPVFATYSDDLVQGFAMDMSIAYVDDSSTIPLEIEDGVYTVEIPVPAVLNTCTKFAVAVCKADGLSQLIEVKPVNGVLNFTVQRFQTLAIVGFGDSLVSIQSLSQTPWLIVGVVASGVLLIVLGVLLLVLVTFRRRKVVNAIDNDESDESLVMFDEGDEIAISAAKEEEETLSEVTVSLDEEETEEFVEVLPEVEVKLEIGTDETSDESDESLTAAQTQKENANHSLDDMLDEVLNDLENMDS